MSDWVKKFKGSGPWAFSKQPDKWGYLNNKWWSTQQDAIEFNAILGYPPSHLNIKDRHIPCGHWHHPSPPEGIPFPVGRGYGWDSLYAEPYGYFWDFDYKQVVKVDLVTLDAVNFVPCEPAGYSWKYQIIDVCYRYIYELFGSGPYIKIFKFDVDTMELVASNILTWPHPHGYFDPPNGCADNQAIFCNSVDGTHIVIISTDLQEIVVTEIGDSLSGSISGSRGMKVDPVREVLYANGSGGNKLISLQDLNIVGVVAQTTGGVFGWGDGTWMSSIQVPGAYSSTNGSGMLFSLEGYHPFNPVLIIGTDWSTQITPGGYSNAWHAHVVDACGWTDWAETGMYVTCFNFFGYYSVYNHIESFDFDTPSEGSPTGVFTKCYYPGGLGDCTDDPRLQGIEVACNKLGGYPVTKSIDIHEGTPYEDSIGTYLSKFSSTCDLEVFRHKVEGYKEATQSLPFLEPQVWTMNRTF